MSANIGTTQTPQTNSPIDLSILNSPQLAICVFCHCLIVQNPVDEREKYINIVDIYFLLLLSNVGNVFSIPNPLQLF